ncbi:signal recognition particle-docking protein FtsY [Thauera sp.]|uniref:signal recognition particle-docking protein FtsY n=1 Tax=Thauera sp. TaxID=1905334 RepID=UPI002633DF65|nr:signal recognition particle-docking protein FtsY [Thauera sp.]MCK6409034.1 signal recognition particle-docking protein FtsY [Thauera sp.]
MFGFLKKKFGKSDDAAKAVDSAADAVHTPEPVDGAIDGALPAVLPPSADTQPSDAAHAPGAASVSAEASAPAVGEAPPAVAAAAEASVETAVQAVTEPALTEAPEATVEPEPASESGIEAEVAPEVDLNVEPEVESEAEPEPEPAALVAAPRKSWTERLKAGLARTRQQIGGGLASLFGLRKIDEDLLEELESTLLMADCGVDATQHLIEDLRRRWKRDHLETADQLQKALADGLHEIIAPLEEPLVVDGHQPFIIMIAGVNGSGKTTSIGKLAKYFQAQGKSVLLAAGDTFRAAAREQLMTWGDRNNVTVVAQESGDAAAVIFDAINAARARKIDVVLADTAGRLPTQLHLMEEIAKVRRVIAKADPSGPHEVLLVLDANIGQNALAQVKAFDKATGVTGLVVTKLDGTAKGGVLAAIARQCPKPLRFIGVGEGIDDLQPFKAREFVDALFEPGAGAVKSGVEARR